MMMKMKLRSKKSKLLIKDNIKDEKSKNVTKCCTCYEGYNSSPKELLGFYIFCVKELVPNFNDLIEDDLFV